MSKNYMDIEKHGRDYRCHVLTPPVDTGKGYGQFPKYICVQPTTNDAPWRGPFIASVQMGAWMEEDIQMLAYKLNRYHEQGKQEKS